MTILNELSNIETSRKLIDPRCSYVNETTDRVPISDWYWPDRSQRAGFPARSAVGGFFIKMMENRLVNKIKK